MSKVIREKKFNDEEVLALVEAIQPHYHKLFGPLNNKLTKENQEKLWNEVVINVNAVRTDVVRTKDKIKEKFGYLKTDTKRFYQQQIKDMRKTGGGEPPASPPLKFRLIKEMLPEEYITGLRGCER